METKTLIQLLNYSRTLIHDGEIKFLYFNQFPKQGDDVGAEHRKLIASWERQLRENPPKSRNPEAVRKEILGYLEREKKYGEFRGSKELYSFVEGSLVFQFLPQNVIKSAYRLEVISRFEKYPSLGSTRFFNGGDQFNFFSDSTKIFKWYPPNQFANNSRIGYSEKTMDGNHPGAVIMANKQLPSFPIDQTQVDVRLSSENTNTVPTYIITYMVMPPKNVKAKVYVRLNMGLPEVYREEYYFRGDSPQADADGYWLAIVYTYSDFELVEALNISIPKVREDRQFRKVDGFMRRHAIMIIKEMDFNLDLPSNFFDWEETELSESAEKHEENLNDIKKEGPQGTQE